MANLFKDILKDSNSLIISPIALDYDYQPKLIPYREKEQFHIASCIKPLFQGINGKNLVIIGRSGVGKTVSTRKVLLEIEQESNNVIPIYINCWKTETTHKIVLEICSRIGYRFTQGRDSNELFNEVVKILNKKAVVFCFDEIDKIKELSIIYNILNELNKKSVLLITNNKDFLAGLDERIKSRLTPEVLEFKPYTLDEVRGILKQRMEYAFVSDVFDEDAFELITEKTYELKDMRNGMFLLKESALIVESKGLKKVSIEHAKEAVNKLSNFKVKSSSDLENMDREVLDVIKENQGKTIKELYNVYVKNDIKKISYRNFCRKIESLEKAGFISKEEAKEVAGKASIIRYEKT